MNRGALVGIVVGVAVALGGVAWLAAPAPSTPEPVQRPKPRARADRPKHPEGPREHDFDVPATRPDAAAGSPNVVLVFGCTVRKDQTSVYSELPTTPWLAQLAETGAVFDDALSVSSWTRASVIGVLTAQHPLALNMAEPERRQSDRVLPPVATTLAEHLREAGWLTIGSTANPNLNFAYGMAQGMDRYRDSFPRAFKHDRQSGKRVVDEALALLDARSPTDQRRPFYLQLMLIDAHQPRRPSAADIARFEGPLADYRASLLQLDRALLLLDTGLAERGYSPENTLFVFVADHGEGLDHPAHHGDGHGKKMYPTTVEIPWIVRGPGVPAGRRIGGLASGVDVTPTVLGLLGRPQPESSDGHDLSAWVRGERDDPTERQRAFSASMFHVADVAAIWTPTHQCQDHYEHDRDKVVEGCFDRRADPDFTAPVAMPELRAELARTRAALMAQGEGIEVAHALVSDEVSEQLELLGYTDR